MLDPATDIEPWLEDNGPRARSAIDRDIRRVARVVVYEGPFERLPYGPHGWDVRSNHRRRLGQSLAQSIRIRGYQRTTVAHIIELAGVSRRGFYELYDNKQHCLEALVEECE